MNLQKIKLWYKRLTCKHQRMAEFYPEKVFWWNTMSGSKGEHKTVLMKGCLNCHKVWIKDYGE